MMNAARNILIAKIVFQGRSGSGYAIDSLSISGSTPSTIPAEI